MVAHIDAMGEKHTYEIASNRPLAAGTYEMTLRGPSGALRRPGQFAGLALPGRFLRRPFSVAERSGNGFTVVYKTVGEGTRQMSAMRPGETLDALVGLGNGFDAGADCSRPLLVGGGAGVPPLLWLARELASRGRRVRAALGFNTAAEAFYAGRFAEAGAETEIYTADGGAGRPGLVTEALGGECDYIFACGPLPMLRALHAAARCGGQYSFEERMGCGYGACMGCTCRTASGPKRVCREGPVLKSEDIVW